MNLRSGLYKFSCLVFTATVLLGLTGKRVEAATYYVAPTGTDSNSGTQSQPFGTINKGVTILMAGDTLYVRGGVYAEWFNNNLPGGTSWSNPITIAAFPGESVTIRPGMGAERVVTIARSSSQYLIIDGFVLDGINVSSDTVKITHGSTTGAAHHIRIKNCEVKNGFGQGILVSSESHYNEFINLDIHHNGRDSARPDKYHGIYVTSKYNLIEGCRIHDNPAYGIHLYAAGGVGVDSNTVRNNRIYSNPDCGILISSGVGNVVYNNLVWGNRGFGGIRADYGAFKSKIYNNTSYANTGNGILIGSGSNGTEIMNNLTFNNAIANLSNGGTATVSQFNLTGIDPKFVNPSALDFSLQAGSPAIDAGAVLTTITSDILGAPRPVGPRFDIGAFEYQSSPSAAAGPSNLRILP